MYEQFSCCKQKDRAMTPTPLCRRPRGCLGSRPEEIVFAAFSREVHSLQALKRCGGKGQVVFVVCTPILHFLILDLDMPLLLGRWSLQLGRIPSLTPKCSESQRPSWRSLLQTGFPPFIHSPFRHHLQPLWSF